MKIHPYPFHLYNPACPENRGVSIHANLCLFWACPKQFNYSRYVILVIFNQNQLPSEHIFTFKQTLTDLLDLILSE